MLILCDILIKWSFAYNNDLVYYESMRIAMSRLCLFYDSVLSTPPTTNHLMRSVIAGINYPFPDCVCLITC